MDMLESKMIDTWMNGTKQITVKFRIRTWLEHWFWECLKDWSVEDGNAMLP